MSLFLKTNYICGTCGFIASKPMEKFTDATLYKLRGTPFRTPTLSINEQVKVSRVPLSIRHVSQFLRQNKQSIIMF